MADIDNKNITLEGSAEVYQDAVFLFCESGQFNGFYVSQEDNIKMQCDITDQYVEDNTSIQDHIGIKPLTFTLRGKIGDLVYNAFSDSSLADDLYNNITSASKISLKTIESLCPALPSNYMAVAYGKGVQIYDNVRKVATKAGNVIGFAFEKYLGKSNPLLLKYAKYLAVQNATGGYTGEYVIPKKLAIVVAELEKHRLMRTKFTMRNDFGSFDSCYLQDIDIKQSDRYTAEVTIQLKQIRFVSTQTTQIDYSKYQSFVGAQRTEAEEQQRARGTTLLIEDKGVLWKATKDAIAQKG